MSAQCVAITGATTGIGYGIAEAFAQKGARLVINSHVEDTVAAERLGALTECHFIRADMSTVEGAEGFVAEAHAKLGRLDTLVNNAGTFRDSDFGTLDARAFTQTIDLNVRGYLFAAQAFANLVGPEQSDASIVCIGSSNSLQAEKNSVIYDTSKGAVLMMVRSLAVSLAERSIRCNGVGPGLITTPLTQAGLDRPGARDAVSQKIPLGRVGDPQDIGPVVVFLASPEARYVTGQMLYVDGGITAQQTSWEPA
ncbi:SDR family NAD(P)-dependent oxidoreductase [Devosia sp.]|uniref:SDR family NAD(P)-dependent oxidoreductase n=1 Tax=Devosia sp. TaxID=1871048 RepID=UPI003A9576B8